MDLSSNQQNKGEWYADHYRQYYVGTHRFSKPFRVIPIQHQAKPNGFYHQTGIFGGIFNRFFNGYARIKWSSLCALCNHNVFYGDTVPQLSEKVLG